MNGMPKLVSAAQVSNKLNPLVTKAERKTGLTEKRRKLRRQKEKEKELEEIER